jgi:hypothetical protein
MLPICRYSKIPYWQDRRIPEDVFIQADVDNDSTIGLSEAVMILRELGE